jgi:hypothetical protein
MDKPKMHHSFLVSETFQAQRNILFFANGALLPTFEEFGTITFLAPTNKYSLAVDERFDFLEDLGYMKQIETESAR